MSKVQILIVGDERMVSLCLESRLKKLGYSVPVMATTGEDAIKKAKESNPDLVLMDIGLADEMAGIEAAEIIRSRFKIPVIFLATNADEEGFKSRHYFLDSFGFFHIVTLKKTLFSHDGFVKSQPQNSKVTCILYPPTHMLC